MAASGGQGDQEAKQDDEAKLAEAKQAAEAKHVGEAKQDAEAKHEAKRAGAAKHSAADLSKETEKLVTDIHGIVGSVPLKYTIKFDVNDSVFFTKLKAMRAEFANSLGDESIRQAALDFFDARVAPIFEEIHDKALDGEVYNKQHYADKIDNVIDREFKSYIESQVQMLAKPSQDLQSSQKALYQALQGDYKGAAPDEKKDIEAAFAEIKTQEEKAKTTHQAALASREAGKKAEADLEKTLEAAKQLAKDEEKAQWDLEGLKNQNSPEAEKLRAQLAQYKRFPKDEEGRDIAQQNAARAQELKEAKDKRDDLESKKPQPADLTRKQSELREAQANLESLRSQRDKEEKKQVKLQAEYKRLDEEHTRIDPANREAARDALQARNQAMIAFTAQKSQVDQMEHSIGSAENRFTTLGGEVKVMEQKLSEFSKADAAYKKLDDQGKLISDVAKEQQELYEAKIPESLRSAFDRMHEAGEKLRDAQKHLETKFNSQGDEVLVHAENAKTFVRGHVQPLAQKMLYQEFKQAGVEVKQDFDLRQQIAAGAEKVNSDLYVEVKKAVDQAAAQPGARAGMQDELKAIKEDIDNPSSTTTATDRFDKLMLLATETNALRDSDKLSRLTYNIEFAQEVLEESETKEPSRREVIQHLEQLQALSQNQFERNKNWYVKSQEDQAVTQMTDVKGAQTAQVDQHNGIHTKLLAEATRQIAEAKTEAEKNRLTALRDKAVQDHAALNKAQTDSSAVITEMKTKTKTLLEDKVAGEHFAYMKHHLKRQEAGLRTNAMRLMWDKKEGEFYTCNPNEVVNLSSGMTDYPLAAAPGKKAGKGIEYEGNLVYRHPRTGVRIAYLKEGTPPNEVYSARLLGLETGGNYLQRGVDSALGMEKARAAGYNIFIRLDVERFKKNKSAEFDMLFEAGHRQVNVMPPKSALDHFDARNSADRTDLYKTIKGTMDVVAAKQLNIYKASKLPAKLELKEQFANSYIVTDTGKQYNVYFVDQKGEAHTLQVDPEIIKQQFKRSDMLTLGKKGVRDMEHLTSKTDKTIRGGSVQRLNLGVDQLRCMKELMAADPHMPREKDKDGKDLPNMIWQSQIGLGSPDDVEQMKREIHQRVIEGKLNAKDADKLLIRLDVFKRDIGYAKKLEAKEEQKVEDLDQERGQLRSGQGQTQQAEMLSRSEGEMPIPPVPAAPVTAPAPEVEDLDDELLEETKRTPPPAPPSRSSISEPPEEKEAKVLPPDQILQMIDKGQADIRESKTHDAIKEKLSLAIETFDHIDTLLNSFIPKSGVMNPEHEKIQIKVLDEATKLLTTVREGIDVVKDLPDPKQELDFKHANPDDLSERLLETTEKLKGTFEKLDHHYQNPNGDAKNSADSFKAEAEKGEELHITVGQRPRSPG